MSDITDHFAARVNHDLPATNAELRALIAAHEFESAMILAGRMYHTSLAEVDDRGQTVLHLLAVHPECDEGAALLRKIASRVATPALQHKDVNGHTAADLAFYAGRVRYKQILQAYHRYPLNGGESRAPAPSTPSAPCWDQVPA